MVNQTSFSQNCLFFFLFFFLLLARATQAQTVSGSIRDAETGEPLIGASIVVKGTTTGVTTDFNGEFSFDARSSFPFTLMVSYIGYDVLEQEIKSAADLAKPLRIRLGQAAEMIKEVVVVETRITEKQKESPLTVESFGLKAIKETPSASFYDGLGSLKGVDLTTASMGFVVINTRGFNSTRPVRSLQLVDGADNQAPGLNFSLGNFVGATELDIQKVDLVVGASSAFYGPNAFNGVINMTTKNPFYHPGLSVMYKMGERDLFEGALRYARKFANKNGDDKFAFKINLSYLRAYDWEADNYDPTEQSDDGVLNWGGYDAVNIYGDENLTSASNNFLSDFGRAQYPGLQRFYRTGYREIDLVDYDIRNLKASGSLHYRIKPDVEASYTYSFGTGTTVYQGDNRYSLKGLQFHQQRLEIGKPEKWFVRGYHTREDAGQSYDAVFTALLLQDAAKSNGVWSDNYISYYSRNIRSKVWNLPGFPNPNNPAYTSLWFGEQRFETYAWADSIMEMFSDSMWKWHMESRAYADGVGAGGVELTDTFFVPGTARFDSLFNEIVSRNTFLQGGSRFFDRSSLSHVQGEYIFDPEWLKITTGGNFRLYTPYSQGTIFLDTADTRIRNWEMGVYVGAERRLAHDRLILTGTARMDKNQNFPVLVSPAASAVWKQNQDHTFRLSFSSAIRNPTLQDQYLYYNVGRAILIGNLEGFDSLVTVPSLFDAYEDISFNPSRLEYFNVDPVRPEKVRTIEVGYKGTLFRRLFVDMSYYYSFYRDFLGFRIGAEIEIDTVANFVSRSQVYRVSANSPDQVHTQGFSLGATLAVGKFYAFTGNYSWNRLDRRGSEDPIIPAFNTPEHKFNIGFSGRDISTKIGNRTLKYWGFAVNYKWVEGFLFEGSPQFTGEIPSYGLLDAQLNYRIPKIYTTVKVGASNLLNNMVFQTYGGPRVGRLAYFSLLFDIDKF